MNLDSLSIEELREASRILAGALIYRASEQAFGYNQVAGLSCEPDTMRDGPDVRLSPGVGAVRVSRRLRP